MIKAKAIKPQNTFKPGVFRIESLAAMNKVADGIIADEKKIVATWEHEVKFEKRVTAGSTVNLQVWTDDEIYNMLDKGTKPHDIKPKHAKVLAFPGGKYQAKTKSRFIGSNPGGASGATAFVPEVHHPGTKARKWTDELFKRWRSRIYDSVSKAYSQAAKKSGHSAS